MNLAPCPACGAPRTVPGVCNGCGAVEGEGHRCPHCRGLTRVEPHPTLRFVCAACGGPKLQIAVEDPSAREAVNKALVQAKPRSPALVVLSVFFTALATLFMVLSTITLAKVGFMALFWLNAALVLWMRKRSRDEHKVALDRAYTLAAKAHVRTHGGGTARELAKLFGMSEGEAESVLAGLAGEAPTRIDVDPSGEVRYRISGEDQSELEEFDERLAEAEKAKASR